MGRMKHGKPNPHNDRSKVIVKKKHEKEKKKNEEVGDKNEKAGADGASEEYRKRLLESNHDRYDEPDIESEDEDNDVSDETKSLEYIRTHYIKEAGMTMDEVEELLVKRSGWFGLCGDTNARTIETGVRNNEEIHVLTKSIMVHRIRKYIGAYLLTLGGEVDAIVMTAGLGENWPMLRLWCLENLQKFGIEIDQDKNEEVISREDCMDVSTFRSSIKVLVIPTDEERHIANQTLQVIADSPS